MHKNLDRGLRSAEHLCGVFETEPLEAQENEGLPLAHRQTEERLLRDLQHLARDDCAIATMVAHRTLLNVVVLGRGRLMNAPHSLATRMIAKRVASNGQHPWDCGGVGDERRPRSVNTEKCFLRQVIRERQIGANAHQECAHAGSPQAVQFVEGAVVAASKPIHEVVEDTCTGVSRVERQVKDRLRTPVSHAYAHQVETG